MIQADCSCGRKLKLRDELAGKRVKCPECRAVVDVPSRLKRSSRTTSRPKQARRGANKSRPAAADGFYDDEPAAPKRNRSKRKKRKPVPVKFIAMAVTVIGVLGGGGFLAFYFGRDLFAEFTGKIVEPTVVEYRGLEFQIPAATNLKDGFDNDLTLYDTKVAREYHNSCKLPNPMYILWYDFYPVEVSEKPALQKLLSATNSREALSAFVPIHYPDEPFSKYEWGELKERNINGLTFATIDFEHSLIVGDTRYGRLYLHRDVDRQVVYSITNKTGHNSSDMKLFDNICASIRKVGDPPVAKSPQERKQESETAVLQRWNDYLAANQSGDTNAIASMLHSQSIPSRREIQELALSATREELNEMEFWKVFSILSLRAGYTRSQLQTPAIDDLIGTMSPQEVRSFRSMQATIRLIGDYAEVIDQQSSLPVAVLRQEAGEWKLCPCEHAEKHSREMELAAMAHIMKSGGATDPLARTMVGGAATILEMRGLRVPQNLFGGPSD